jgi:GNAT superfamily N-acetyltransferase
MKKDASGNKCLRIEPCNDITLLAGMFLELAEDESSDKQRTEKQALEEMKALLERGERAYALTADGKIAGYALVDVSCKPPYLHHFYICRGERRKGYGRAAFRLLLETLKTNEIDLDVYVWNERGRAFWDSLGFKPRTVVMRYSP